jgi:hypothetical protein
LGSPLVLVEAAAGSDGRWLYRGLGVARESPWAVRHHHLPAFGHSRLAGIHLGPTIEKVNRRIRNLFREMLIRCVAPVRRPLHSR